MPTSVIVRMLNEVADEMENILQRSCISLYAVQNIGLDNSTNQTVSFQDSVKSSYLDCDDNVECSGMISNDKIPFITTTTTENHLSFETCQSLSAYANINSKPLQVTLAPNYSSADVKSSIDIKTQEARIQEEFNCCFDEHTLNEEKGLCFKPNNILSREESGKKQRNLVGGSRFWKSISEVKNDSELSTKTKSATFLVNHNMGINKNNSKLLNISDKFPVPGDNSGDQVFNGKGYGVFDMKNCKKADLRGIRLRSRYLTNWSSLESTTLSKNHDCNAECNVVGNGYNKVSKNSATRSSETNSGSKVEQTLSNFKTESSVDNVNREIYWIDLLADSLAHGNENEMSLALQILKKHFRSSKKSPNGFSFPVDHINVQSVLGPLVFNSCVLEGVVIELSKENQSIVVGGDSNTPRRIALVKGDITYNYRHLGFKHSVQVTQTLSKDYFGSLSLNAESKWMNHVILLIKSLNIGIVAVHGHVADVLRDHLQALGVVTLENVKTHKLDVLSKLTGTSIVSYILDLGAQDIGKKVWLRIWNSGWSSGKYSTKSGTEIQTLIFRQISLWYDERCQQLESTVNAVMLCGVAQDLVNDSELKFWNCIHRLRNAFEDQCVLPGKGDVERISIHYLQNIKGNFKNILIAIFRHCWCWNN